MKTRIALLALLSIGFCSPSAAQVPVSLRDTTMFLQSAYTVCTVGRTPTSCEKVDRKRMGLMVYINRAGDAFFYVASEQGAHVKAGQMAGSGKVDQWIVNANIGSWTPTFDFTISMETPGHFSLFLGDHYSIIFSSSGCEMENYRREMRHSTHLTHLVKDSARGTCTIVSGMRPYIPLYKDWPAPWPPGY